MNDARFLEACKAHAMGIRTQESLADHCSFKTGGCARYFCAPNNSLQLATLLKLAHTHEIPVVVLGEGTNVLPPDTTLNALVIATTNIRGVFINMQYNSARIMAGQPVRSASAYLACRGKAGLEFLYGMPGSIGGAVWMNARCYGKEISEVLLRARGYTVQGSAWEYSYDPEDFAYKVSPFQNTARIITECEVSLCDEDAHTLWRTMMRNEMDRRSKGHYSAPCAGSVFKNNYAHGEPAGRILEKLGYKGMRVGGACVSHRHANIITTTPDARSRDVFELSERMREKAHRALHITLDREIILLGDQGLWTRNTTQ